MKLIPISAEDASKLAALQYMLSKGRMPPRFRYESKHAAAADAELREKFAKNQTVPYPFR